jgi:aminoglycoside phosphotransferase (APT) family kinase protein
VGLGDFGRPEGFLARQVRRWGAQLDASRSRDLPGVEELRSRLADTVPASDPGAAVVHGDYRLDNLVVGPPSAPDAYRVRAVLDWEMATLGDPLADLGLLVAYWDGLGRLPASSVAALGPAAGLPEGPVLVAEYAARSGRDVSALPWYVAFGYFKIAVILEGIHYRFEQGQTIGPGFDRIGEVVPLLVTLGLSALP